MMTEHIIAVTFFISDHYESKTTGDLCYLINMVK